MTSDQDSFDAGRTPSSGSVADPEKEMTSPTFQVRVEAGETILGTGGRFETSIRCVTPSMPP